MKALLTGLAYLAALVLAAGVVGIAVLFVAGPHAGLLPSWLEGVVLALGWVLALGLPVVPARWVWRRLSR